MSRTTIAALAAAAVVLSLTACTPSAHPDAHASAITTARPHPTASHLPAATATATPTPAALVAALSTSPGDELLTFSGTARSANGSTVALSFTLHSPVAWNGPGGSSTLAALSGASRAAAGADLLDPSWDAAHGVSLAVVDYSARMTAGSWVDGQNIVLDLGPDQSEVPVSTAGLTLDSSRWVVAGPGSGHYVVAFPNINGSTPNPSAWGDALQIYGFETGIANYSDPNRYELSNCRLDLTALGSRPANVPEDWFTPDASYCSAGIGE